MAARARVLCGDAAADRGRGHRAVAASRSQWRFRAGDAIFFGMYLLHSSTENTTNRFRIGCDTRCRLASEPVDDRWIGQAPKGHTPKDPAERVSIEEVRKAGD
ncbi:phytanoyl-CoA dioxygenase family protein [Paenibacillus hemerocallicola]|uniref:Phytanoyl-CoA dioxygenase family protein n=1 Tax=Paenibacillus hemerocallicola TaxID=1172614 RepID=A0A5C4T8M9_9BACL|nr:phytanoyl-CoA dioxygenase family protein [Paenibacillus hemerocallicola]TNJ65428.1 phytanoyl-CoA dioxygenase family protein [Paenibacillus hemerocallicola]